MSSRPKVYLISKITSVYLPIYLVRKYIKITEDFIIKEYFYLDSRSTRQTGRCLCIIHRTERNVWEKNYILTYLSVNKKPWQLIICTEFIHKKGLRVLSFKVRDSYQWNRTSTVRLPIILTIRRHLTNFVKRLIYFQIDIFNFNIYSYEGLYLFY